MAQGQWERICKHLLASETAAEQTDDKDQLPEGVCLQAIWLLYVHPFAYATVSAPHHRCSIICVGLAVCLRGLKKVGGKKEAAKASPL